MEDLLKEFWPVALFIGISIISYMRNEAKAKNGKAEAQQPHTLDENFPSVEYVETISQPSSPAVKPQPSRGNKNVKHEPLPGKKTIKPDEPVEKATANRGAKIALKGKSDVKKAFIYSEILNRKYK